MSKAPAFQLYTSDWLSAMKINLMTPAEEGGYIRLLCYAWESEDCGLPNDDEILAKLSRLGDDFKGSSSTLKNCFLLVGDRLVSKRLAKEREKQKAWAAKCSAGGKRSAKSRKAKELSTVKGTCNLLATKHQLKGNSSSSSSSSSSYKDKKEKEEEKELSLLPDSDSQEPPPDPVIETLCQELMDRWNAMANKFGCQPCRGVKGSKAGSRRSIFETRLKDSMFRENWRAAIEEVPKTPRNVGHNPDKWLAHIDWFLQDGRVLKLIEKADAKPTGGAACLDDDEPAVPF